MGVLNMPPRRTRKVRFDAAGVLNFVNHFVSKDVNTIRTLRLDHLMSMTLPSLDVVFRIEAYRLSIATRDGNDVGIFVL